MRCQDGESQTLARWFGMSGRGMGVSAALCPTIVFTGCIFSLGAMVLAAAQRRMLISRFQLKEEARCALCCAFVCYPCALWRHAVFLQEMVHEASIKESEMKNCVIERH